MYTVYQNIKFSNELLTVVRDVAQAEYLCVYSNFKADKILSVMCNFVVIGGVFDKPPIPDKVVLFENTC